MNTLRDYVEWKLTHSDKTAVSEGYPLVLENCKSNKKMKNLKIYGNSIQDGTPSPENPIEVLSVGNLVTDESDVNFGKYKIAVAQSGKNLFNPLTVSASSTSNISVGYPENSSGTIIDSTDLRDNTVTIKEVVYDTNAAIEGYQNGYFVIMHDCLTEGKQYILSFDIDIHSNPSNVNKIRILPGGLYPVYDTTFSKNKQRVSFTFTEKRHSDAKRIPYVEIRCMAMKFTASNFMITEVGYDTEFEPYVEPQVHNVYLDEPLRKIGDYADYIDFKNQRVVRNTLKYVYDKGGNFVVAQTSLGNSGEYVQFALNQNALDILPGYDNATSSSKPVVEPLCEQFPVTTSAWNSKPATIDKEQWFCSRLTSNIRPIILKSRLTYDENASNLDSAMLTAFGNWLKENPVTVYYALWNPVNGEDISLQLPKPTSKTTVFTVDSTIEPSNMYGKYIK